MFDSNVQGWFHSACCIRLGEQKGVEVVCWRTVQLCTRVLEITFHAFDHMLCEINDLFYCASQFLLDCMFGHAAAAVAVAVAFIPSLALAAR